MADTSSRLARRILIGAALGLTTGLAIGERAAALEPLGTAYAALLEMAVYPFLICSLLVGLGEISRERTLRLVGASWRVYLLLWGMTFLTMALLAAVLPPTPAPTLLEPPTGHAPNLVDLIIPANIFAALVRNVVPAIVLFAGAYAVAIQTAPDKAALLAPLDVFRKASLAIWGWIVNFAPLGVFALFASTAGTVDASAAEGLAVYSGLFLLGCFGLCFLVLPFTLSRIVPLRTAEILRELQPAFALALVTTLPVTSLPLIQKAAETLCRGEGVEGEEAGAVVKASLSIAYVLCQLGNYFIAFFVVYAAYEARVTPTLGQWALLPPLTILSSVGTPSASIDGVAFLADWLRLPPTSADLYVETMTVTRYGQVAVSVMGFAFVTLASTLIYFGRARLRLVPVLGGLGATLALFGGLALASRALPIADLFARGERDFMARTLDPDLLRAVDATVLTATPPLDRAGTLDGIEARGRLRVGYDPAAMPFSYVNAAGTVVGYDVAAAYRLARDLGVALDLAPVAPAEMEAALAAGRLDVVMAGALATPDRLRTLAVSDFYEVEPVAFLAPAGDADRFRDLRTLAAEPAIVAVLADPVLERRLRRLLPRAEVQVVASYEALPDGVAAFWTRARAAAWAATHPGLTAVVPAGDATPMPLGYLMPPGSADLRRYLDLWLSLEAGEGVRQAAADYWLAVHPRIRRPPRWNFWDDVIAPALSSAG